MLWAAARAKKLLAAARNPNDGNSMIEAGVAALWGCCNRLEIFWNPGG
jgi:hypothetical protein